MKAALRRFVVVAGLAVLGIAGIIIISDNSKAEHTKITKIQNYPTPISVFATFI